ncbi:MAG: DUF565 domain-containing protein [Cyanothece sp. SIO1E1]|nr:DUF565 domain-containing protein [Cyanothece sp. SIO1E1]
MQNTRLNSLISSGIELFAQWLRNPWRRLSLVIISLLFGFFLASIIVTTTGQTQEIDAVVAIVLVVWVELISRWVYGSKQSTSRLPLADALNALKIGAAYGLYLEALKLGS